jgi:hypothetical protein
MRARTRNVLTVAALVYIGLVGYLFGEMPLRSFNVLLATTVVPLVWLVWAFCRWSAYQHSNRWARDIEKVHGPQPVRAGAR